MYYDGAATSSISGGRGQNNTTAVQQLPTTTQSSSQYHGLNFPANSNNDDAVEQHLHYIPDGRVRCVSCNDLFKNINTARQHVKLRHTPQNWYECSICKAVLRGKLYFSQHFSKRHFKGATKVVENYGKLVSSPPQNNTTIELH